MQLSNFKKAIIALIIANIIWGVAPPVFKLALQDIGPFSLAFLRFFAAAILIFPFAYKHLKIEKQDIAEVFLLGFLGVTINIAFFFLGLKFAPSINASIIGSAGPIFLILFAFIFLREKARSKLILGAFIGLAGVLIIMTGPLFTSGPNLNLLGNFFFFLAMLGSIGHIIIGRKLLKKYEPLGVTFWAFSIGALCFLPLFINENLTHPFYANLTTPVIAALIYGILFSSLVAYFLLFWALKYLPAADTGMFVYIDPIVTVVAAFFLLREVPDAFYIAGSILVFTGIYIAEGRIHWHPLHLLRKG